MVAENDVPGGPPAAAAPVVAPQWPWLVLFALFGAGLTTYSWASACPAKPLATFLLNQAWGLGTFLGVCALAGALAGKGPFHGLRLPLSVVPLYLVGLVP